MNCICTLFSHQKPIDSNCRIDKCNKRTQTRQFSHCHPYPMKWIYDCGLWSAQFCWLIQWTLQTQHDISSLKKDGLSGRFPAFVIFDLIDLFIISCLRELLKVYLVLTCNGMIKIPIFFNCQRLLHLSVQSLQIAVWIETFKLEWSGFGPTV